MGYVVLSSSYQSHKLYVEGLWENKNFLFTFLLTFAMIGWTLLLAVRIMLPELQFSRKQSVLIVLSGWSAHLLVYFMLAVLLHMRLLVVQLFY